MYSGLKVRKMYVPEMYSKIRGKNGVMGGSTQHFLSTETRSGFGKFLTPNANLLSISISFLYPSPSPFIPDISVNYGCVFRFNNFSFHPSQRDITPCVYDLEC